MMEGMNKRPKGENLSYGGGLFSITTYGCQMNAHDSEQIAGMLADMGFSETPDAGEADIILYNTCCVRETAERRVFGNIGWLKEIKQNRPHVKIVVCGCMMQQEGMAEKTRARFPHVDVIVGTKALPRLPVLLREALDTGEFVSDTRMDDAPREELPGNRRSPYHAYVNIMYGCNNFCSYCIVPYVRGREVSRPRESILAEIRALREEGVMEIMLLGQNVNSYGKDLEEETDFAALLRAVDETGIPRIRFMTSHPKDISDALIDVMAASKHIAPQLHLPVQSGSNAVLRAMNRKYTAEHYRETIEKARAKMPNIGLSTDIIVGFPGESEADFEETMALMRDIRYDSAYTFVYSPRSGTPAASMPGAIDKEEKSRRIRSLIEQQNAICGEIYESLIGSRDRVLADGIDGKMDGFVTGKTGRGCHVRLPGGPDDMGHMLDIRVARCENGNKLIAERV